MMASSAADDATLRKLFGGAMECLLPAAYVDVRLVGVPTTDRGLQGGRTNATAYVAYRIMCSVAPFSQAVWAWCRVMRMGRHWH